MKKAVGNITRENALQRLMEICSRKEKSVSEVKKKIVSWGLEDKSEQIITALKEQGFINEERFAKAFANDKLKFNKWGKIKIRYTLKQHAISDTILENVLGEMDEEEYYSILSSELSKKRASLKKLSAFQLKAKLYAFGQQRGYESEILNRFFSEEIAK